MRTSTLAATLLLTGCSNGNIGGSKTVTSFYGHDVLTMPSNCEKEVVFTDSFKTKTKCCKLESTDGQSVYAVYVDDGSEDNGKFLTAYAVLNNSVKENRATLDSYLQTFQDKYGRFGSNTWLSGAAKLCDPAGQNCRTIFTTYTPEKRYTSTGWTFLEGFRGGATGATEVAIWDDAMLSSLNEKRAKEAKDTGKSLVK